MKSILRFFAKEHLLGNLITLLVFVFGIYGLSQIRRDIWPNVQFNITTVMTFLGGASPEQVEKLLINPIEEALREVDGIKKVLSTATESKSVTIIQLDPDSRSPEKTNADIKQAIDRIDSLPEDAETPIVTAIEAGQTPVIEVTLFSDELSPFEIRQAAKALGDELSLLPAVARVQKKGYLKREYEVLADPRKLAERRVSLGQLIEGVKARNVSFPGGSIEVRDGMESMVRTEGGYESPEDVARTVLLANEAGFGTKIGDVAEVRESLAKPEEIYRSNGQASLNLVVAKKVNADTFQLISSIKSTVERVQKSLPESLKIGYSNDFSIYLSNRLNALSSNLFIGLALVLIVLALFLPWQVNLVVSLGMPLAILATVLTAHLMGNALNLISLMGLIIVVGMLVDDAIVVSENIWRHVEEGSSVEDAVVNGGSEVFGAVLASILTTVSAFGPMMFMTGIFGAFIFEIPLMVIMALGFSLLEAYIVMPSHFTSWVGPSVQRRISQGESAKRPHWFDKISERYKNFVAWSLGFRYRFLGLIFALLVAVVILLVNTGRFILFPPEGIEIFFVQVEAPTGTSLDKMAELLEPIETKILAMDPGELKDFVSILGVIQQDPMDPQTRRGSHFANLRVALTPQHLRERSALEIVDELREQIGTPQGIKRVVVEYARQGPPQGRPISLNLLGPDFKVLRELATQVQGELEKIEGVRDVQNSFIPGKTEWQILPRHQDTAMVGLTAAEIGQSIRAAFEGVIASSIRVMDEEIDVRVKLKHGQIEQETSESLFKNVQIGNRSGNLIPISSIADFRPVETMSSINHYKFKRMINVSADVDIDKKTPAEVVAQIRPSMKEISDRLPEYSIEFGGDDEDTAESMKALGTAFIFAACIIFALLIITFKNIFQPLLILTSIPLGFMGVAIAMFVHNRPFSFLAMLGVIALAGVIVNNAIVFLDFVNQRRAAGEGLEESIVIAAKKRLRPIVLTTITTVCGLMPTAYGDTLYKIFGVGGGDPFVVPIALSLGWGLLFGSIMTLIFFPSFIRILDDIQALLGRKRA